MARAQWQDEDGNTGTGNLQGDHTLDCSGHESCTHDVFLSPISISKML